MFSKCNVDCIHRGKNIARHRDSNTSLGFCCVYLLAEKILKSYFRVSVSVEQNKPRRQIKAAETISCSRRSVNASEVNDDTRNSFVLLTYDNLWLYVSQRDNQVMIQSSYGNC